MINVVFVFLITFLFLSGCFPASDNMSDKGTINKQINMRETYDSGGEHLQGEAQIDYAGDKEVGR